MFDLITVNSIGNIMINSLQNELNNSIQLKTECRVPYDKEFWKRDRCHFIGKFVYLSNKSISYTNNSTIWTGDSLGWIENGYGPAFIRCLYLASSGQQEAKPHH